MEAAASTKNFLIRHVRTAHYIALSANLCAVVQLPFSPIPLKTRPDMRRDFMHEMQRFLPAATVRETIATKPYWDYLVGVVENVGRQALSAK